MDPSENACIEVLRPKTIPEGLIALGTVIQVTELNIKLQVTGGVICLIEPYNINRIYTSLLEEQHQQQHKQDEKSKVPKLSQLFQIGEQYVCKIIEKRTRKGYTDAQDIIATLDPSCLQEDCLPKTLLSIPNVPIQCVIQSIEDHGYQIDVGFKGLTGFLTFADCFKQKFIVGQTIRCCLKNTVSEDNNSRVVNLTMDYESMKKSKFSQDKVSENVITDRCILPGSKSFLTVMKVVKNGLIVNFMNDFAGFVGPNHLQGEWDNILENYKVSDQFNCTVLYYNHITKTFGLSIRKGSKYRNTLEHFIKNYHTGQVIKKAKVAYIDGTKAVAFKVDNTYKAIANVRDALEDDIAAMTKDELHLALDSAFPDNSTHKCRIKSLNLADLMIVLSLRQDFLQLPFVSVDEIKPADFVEATVKKYVKDGVVVSFGLNLRAIILNNDLHDFISTQSYKMYPIGKTIKCRVLKIDSNKQPSRVYLTNKQELMDPKLTIIDSIDKSFKGKSTYATILKIKSNGLIVELFNNTKGFIPTRFLTTNNIKKIEDIFKIGQVISCVVYDVNPIRNSLRLGVITLEKIIEAKKENKSLKKAKKEMKKSNKLNKKLDIAPDKGKKRIREESDQESDSDESKTEEGDDTELSNKESDTKKEQENLGPPPTKSRRQRSEEAKQREENLREAERRLLDPNRPPQSMLDFESLVLKTPNSADAWIKYSKFMIDNIETEKARLICRRALRTIQFREEKEKLKVWLHLIRIEAKFGGTEKLRATIKEAEQTNDKLRLYQGATKVLTNCNELDEAKNLHEQLLKLYSKSPEVWIDYILFNMEHLKDLHEARNLYEKGCKTLSKSDIINFKSRFAQFEFKIGDVERGKTLFENLLSENPKRTDLWLVYEAMVKKFGLRQIDNDEIKLQNEQLLQRISESIELVSRKGKKKNSSK